MPKKSAKVYPENAKIENMHIGDLYRNTSNTKGSPYLERLPNGTYKVSSKRPKQTSTMKEHKRTSSEEDRFQKRKLASQFANVSMRRRGGRRYRRKKTVRRRR